MQTYRLKPHPTTPALEVDGISVTMMRLMGGELLLCYRIKDFRDGVVLEVTGCPLPTIVMKRHG